QQDLGGAVDGGLAPRVGADAGEEGAAGQFGAGGVGVGVLHGGGHRPERLGRPASPGSPAPMPASTARTSSARWYSLAQATTVSMVAPGLLAAAYRRGPSRFLARGSQQHTL